MHPDELRAAVEQNLPLLLPAGCVEYHGNHLPLGTDTFLAEGIVARIAVQIECVVAPAFQYGPTGYGSGSVQDGTLDTPPDLFYREAGHVIRQCMQMGFRRLYTMQIHQAGQGAMLAALRFVAAEIFNDRYLTHGVNWFIREKESGQQPDYPFLEVLPLIPDRLPAELTPADHAGIGETSLMLALRPDLVRLDLATEADYRRWHRLREADRELGAKMVSAIVAGWVDYFRRAGTRPGG